MTPRIRPLKLAVVVTTSMLLLGALLAALAGFDHALDWDILGPGVEAALGRPAHASTPQ